LPPHLPSPYLWTPASVVPCPCCYDSERPLQVRPSKALVVESNGEPAPNFIRKRALQLTNVNKVPARPRALSLLCPCDGEPPMCTPCIYKPWALTLHMWEAPAGARIWGWSEVPGRAGPKRPVPGYRPFRGPYFVPKRPVRGLPAVCRRGPLNIALFTRQLFNPCPAWAPIDRQRLCCPQATLCR
jgi:hypothetical protein